MYIIEFLAKDESDDSYGALPPMCRLCYSRTSKIALFPTHDEAREEMFNLLRPHFLFTPKRWGWHQAFGYLKLRVVHACVAFVRGDRLTYGEWGGRRCVS